MNKETIEFIFFKNEFVQNFKTSFVDWRLVPACLSGHTQPLLFILGVSQAMVFMPSYTGLYLVEAVPVECVKPLWSWFTCTLRTLYTEAYLGSVYTRRSWLSSPRRVSHWTYHWVLSLTLGLILTYPTRRRHSRFACTNSPGRTCLRVGCWVWWKVSLGPLIPMLPILFYFYLFFLGGGRDRERKYSDAGCTVEARFRREAAARRRNLKKVNS